MLLRRLAARTMSLTRSPAFLSPAAATFRRAPARSLALLPPRSGAGLAAVRRGPARLRMSSAAEGAAATAPAEAEKFEFQAEVSRVMELIINSLYSNKEIFLRELVSNASDACDKKRFLSITKDSAEDEDELRVRVKADLDEGVVVIEDNGVGLTRKEMIDNLGSIATSGTKKFVEALGQGKSDVSQIGQFGVGFYSSFLVADRVTVQSRSYTDPDAKQYRWESDSKSGFTLAEDAPEDYLEGSSGTRLTLHIKKGNNEFLDNSKLATLMRKYSEFVTFPIYAWTQRTEYDEVPDGDEKDEAGNPKTKRVPRNVEEWEQINKQKPIWMRRPREVTDDEYAEFYKSFSRDFGTPLAHSHFAVEGEVEFRSVLFTPRTLPFELRENMFDENGRNLRLYVKRVFISDKFEGFVPRWLTFVRGVVDSEDLPLNVSREILQQSRVLRIISKRLIRKSLDMFAEIAEREKKEEYDTFWNNFGRYIKAGIIDDSDYHSELSKLCRFNSSNYPDELISFQDYADNMKENQESIYYMTADNKIAAQNAPVLETLREKGYDVLFLLEPIDEIAMQNLTSVNFKRQGEDKETSFKLVDVGKEDFNMEDLKSEDEKKSDKELQDEFEPVVEYLQKTLSERISKVQVSSRLRDSASAIIQGQYGMSATMERYMRMNKSTEEDAFGNFMSASRILEINPRDSVVKDLKRRLDANDEGDGVTRDMATLLFELAMLSGGYVVDDTPGFAKRVSRMISDAIVSKPVSEKPHVEEETESKDGKDGKTDGKDDKPEKVDAEIV